jgi:hypothetical protein
MSNKKNVPLWLRPDIFFDGSGDAIGDALAKAPSKSVKE